MHADILYAIVITAIIYPMVAHWAWAEKGWASPYRPADALLAGCGVADFSGSGVVHLTGASSACSSSTCIRTNTAYPFFRERLPHTVYTPVELASFFEEMFGVHCV